MSIGRRTGTAGVRRCKSKGPGLDEAGQVPLDGRQTRGQCNKEKRPKKADAAPNEMSRRSEDAQTGGLSVRTEQGLCTFSISLVDEEVCGLVRQAVHVVDPVSP